MIHHLRPDVKFPTAFIALLALCSPPKDKPTLNDVMDDVMACHRLGQGAS